MTPTEPSQPLTEAEVAAIRDTWDAYRASQSERHGVLEMVPADIGLLDIKLTKVFAEVDRIRAENAQLRRNAALVSDVTPKTTPTSGIVVNVEPPRGGSPANDFAIGYSAGLRNGRRGR